MADLKEVRYSNRTAAREGGCSTSRLPKGKKIRVVVYSCQDLNIMVWMCCSCHSDLSLDIRWQWNLN